MRRLLPAFLTALLVGCGPPSLNHQDFTHTGAGALSHLSRCDRTALPAAMTDLWVFDGGSFNGMIYYVVSNRRGMPRASLLFITRRVRMLCKC